MRSFAFVPFALFAATAAYAQSITTGAVQGRVTDKETGLPFPGVTVMVGDQVAITADDGTYKITELAPGKYDVVFELGDGRAVHTDVLVQANDATPVHHKFAFETMVI